MQWKDIFIDDILMEIAFVRFTLSVLGKLFIRICWCDSLIVIVKLLNLV